MFYPVCSRSSAVAVLLAILVFGSEAAVAFQGAGESETVPPALLSKQEGEKKDSQAADQTSEERGLTADAPVIPARAVQEVTAADVAAVMADLAASTGLEEPVKNSIQKLLQTAQKRIENFETFRGQIAEFQKRIGDVPSATTRLTAEKEKSGAAAPSEAEFRDSTPELLRQMINPLKAEVDEQKKQLLALQEEPARRLNRATEIPARVTELEGQLAELQKQLALAPPANEPSLQTRARQLQLTADAMAIEKEIESLRIELAYYNVTTSLLPLQIESAQSSLAAKSARLDLMQKVLVRKLETALQKTVREAEESQKRALPFLTAYAMHNVVQARRIQESIERTARTTKLQEEASALIDNTKKQFDTSVQRYKNAGASNALGTIFRQRRKDLIKSRIEVSPAADDEAKMREKQVMLFSLQDELDSLVNEEEVADALSKRVVRMIGEINSTDRILIAGQLQELDVQEFGGVTGLSTREKGYEKEIERFREALAGDIAALPAAISEEIRVLSSGNRNIRLDDVSSRFLAIISKETRGFEDALALESLAPVTLLAVRLFAFQERWNSLEPGEIQWLESIAPRSEWIELGRVVFQKRAVELLGSRRAIVSELKGAVEQELNKLAQLNVDRAEAVALVSRYISWIDERVIWIPSAAVIATGDWSNGREAFAWLISPQNWMSVGREYISDFGWNWFGFLPFVAAVLVLFLFRGRLKNIIRETGEEAAKGRCSKILPTFNSLAATFLMAMLWPMILAIAGWTLTKGPPADSFASAVGQSLTSVALFIAPLELLRFMCREYGLANCHFEWPQKTRRFLAKAIRSFYLLSIPLMFIQGIMLAQPNEEYRNSLGRLVSCVLFTVVAWYLHRFFRPNGVVFQQMAVQRPVPGSYRFRVIIHLLAVGLPVTLLVLSLSGYYYTAYQLGGCLEQSLSLLILMIVIGGVSLRWLLVRRRGLAMEEARKARLAVAAASETGIAAGETMSTNTEKSLLDLATVSRQARELVVLGLGFTTFLFLYWIWRDVLPAIAILDESELWSVTIGEKVEKVTWMSMFNAVLAGLLTWLMIRNMPGLLNLAVQKFSTLDSGARYAVTTIFRYIITVIGTITALGFLRIQWAEYSWLVAAVSVGMGFGLQEIVANFISGLILLFERPVRVGDLVTIDNINGVVSRIQMRATTLMTWDHQELVVPNKDLMTGKLLNWTLTDITSRLVLEVGVAYGSDVEQVRKILEDVAAAHPDVMKEPKPVVTLDEFADSALLFRMRVFLASFDKRLIVRHELNSAIAIAFRKAGITIPFPQRDLHVISGDMVDRTALQSSTANDR